MTFYVIYTLTKTLNIILDEIYFTVSELAAKVGGTSANLEPGTK